MSSCCYLKILRTLPVVAGVGVVCYLSDSLYNSDNFIRDAGTLLFTAVTLAGCRCLYKQINDAIPDCIKKQRLKESDLVKKTD